MTNGIYTVTLTSEEDETNTDSADFEVTGRYVAEIVITSDVALTAPDDGTVANPKRKAYAYYDVLDQYGESMRTSASITWSGSCDITANKSNGKLTLEKNIAQDWVYNEQIYVTGVYTKTGITCQKTLTVGTEQALDSIAMKGFVKKGTTEILKTLPADFKDGTYYMIFNVLDQQHNPMDAGKANKNTVTFVSDNVLVVKELTTFAPNPITVDGVEYDAVIVTPGIKVADGGEVTVTAIANKTGNKTEMNFVVGEDAVVTSFTLSSPAVTVADGDQKVEIPFEALDQDGNEIKNFVTLAKQQTFNTITFNASEGDLILAEQDDGTAKLLWNDKTMAWDNAQTTDGIDRPISLTVVVVGGESDNEMISVSDKRRPDAIKEVNVKEVFTENATVTFKNTHSKKASGDDTVGEFKFYDQYGQQIGDKWGDDNGFFAAALAGDLNGTDFAGYHFGVRVTYSGNGEFRHTGGTGEHDGEAVADRKYFVMEDTKTLEFTTGTDVKSAVTGEGFKFEIARISNSDYAANAADTWDTVSTSKFVGATVVDISQVKGFAVKDLDMFYTGTIANVTGDGIAHKNVSTAADPDAAYGAAITAQGLPANYNGRKVEVTGTYNGKDVDVPAAFYKVEGSKLAVEADGTAPIGDNVVTHTKNGLKVGDLYDKTTANGVSKIATDTLKVTVTQKYGNTTTAGTIKVLTSTALTTIANWTDAATAADVDDLFENWAVPVGTLRATVDAKIADIKAITDAESETTKVIPAAVTTNRAAIVAAINAVVTADNAVALGGADGTVLDTATKEVKISDQAPTATSIKGLKESYTIAPTTTEITNVDIKAKLDVPATVYVVDQYGVKDGGGVGTWTADLKFKAADVVENEDGYAENNFKTSNNDDTALSIIGAERGDTFTLTLTSGGATASTAMTVGADANASIKNGTNNYRTTLLPILESQRKAGLN